jgi:hypothetical protein
MESRRWLNQTQPQTLQIAVFLLYFNAVLMVLSRLILNPIGFVWIAASVGGGYGIANERKWGYALGIIAALIPFGLQFAGILSPGILTLLFEVALVALLLHPQSRDYQRIWFK